MATRRAAAHPKTANLRHDLDASITVTLYGKVFNDLTYSEPAEEAEVKGPTFFSASDQPTFGKIYCIGFNGRFTELPLPVVLLLPDEGVPIGDPNPCPKTDTQWMIRATDSVLRFNYTPVRAADLIKIRLLVDIDAHFRFQNVHFNPGNTTITGEINAYLHVHQPLPDPIPDIDITVISATWPFTINATGASINIPFGPATLTLTYTPPATLCGSVHVHVSLPDPIPDIDQTWNLGCIGIGVAA
jgi:hypothetical protein